MMHAAKIPRWLQNAPAALFLLAAFAPSVPAQMVWSLEGTGPSYGEYNAPPPACPILPPPYAVFGPPAGACPPNLPFPLASCFGGTAFDNDGNALSGGPGFPVLIHSDGANLELLTPAGGYITSGSVAGYICPVVSGVAVDAAADVIYLTDGVSVVGVGLPPGPTSCAPPPLLFGPILLPVTTPVCGLAFDSCTGTLWTCDPTGYVEHWTLGAVSLGGFFASPPLFTPLTGITFNTTNGNLQVTDGATVAEFTPTGVLAPAGPFYLSSNPYSVPVWAARVDGIGFSLRPQKFGRGCPPPAPPSIGFTGGYPFAGNAGFSIFQTGATPGKSSFLLVSFGYSCPQLPFSGCAPGFAISLPWFAMLPTGVIPLAGSVSAPIPIPPPAPPPCGLPVGVPLFFQFVNAAPIEMSDGLAFTIGTP
jgi:hypothetical protein